jgi:predicted transcriptional regulator
MYSTKTVFTHFQKLIEKGYIKRITKGKTFRYAVAGMHYVERDDV